MKTRLLKVDDLTREQHFHLTADDDCYYLREYTPRKGYAHSSTNDLIVNLKKCPSKKGTPEYNYKERAIKSVAQEFLQVLSKDVLAYWTFVPIPPSKIATDPLYDDRMTQILFQIAEETGADVRELLKATVSTESSHTSQTRLSPDDLMKILTVDVQNSMPPPKGIILFDDVLTAGSHFRACKNILNEKFPEIPIIGIFIARREILEDECF